MSPCNSARHNTCVPPLMSPVLVLLLPILLQLGTQGAMPPSKTLIPVNAAVLIGGMATTIGTSTNLLVVAIAQDMGMVPFAIFEFAPLVVPAAVTDSPAAAALPAELRNYLELAAKAGGVEWKQIDAAAKGYL